MRSLLYADLPAFPKSNIRSIYEFLSNMGSFICQKVHREYRKWETLLLTSRGVGGGVERSMSPGLSVIAVLSGERT